MFGVYSINRYMKYLKTVHRCTELSLIPLMKAYSECIVDLDVSYESLPPSML